MKTKKHPEQFAPMASWLALLTELSRFTGGEYDRRTFGREHVLIEKIPNKRTRNILTATSDLDLFNKAQGYAHGILNFVDSIAGSVVGKQPEPRHWERMVDRLSDGDTFRYGSEQIGKRRVHFIYRTPFGGGPHDEVPELSAHSALDLYHRASAYLQGRHEGRREADRRHLDYLEKMEKILGPIRLRRESGEPAVSDFAEVRRLADKAITLAVFAKRVLDAEESRGDRESSLAQTARSLAGKT